MLRRPLALACALALLGAAARARAPEAKVARIASAEGPHRVWVTDRIFDHSLLFDGDDGHVLGMVDGPVGAVTPKLPLHSHVRGEIYSVDIAYSRGKRGERVDFVTIYDPHTLAVVGEIVLPTRTGDANTSLGYAALLDGDRFLATFNQFPQASVSIVDLADRRFVGEVPITGCAGIFPVGELRFATLCGDGTVAAVSLDADGHRLGLSASQPFFDAVRDPVTMAGVRDGSRWWFVSFEGFAHAVDFAAEVPSAAPPWSLLDDEDRAEGWRVGGLQHLALHVASRRLYSLVHRGEPGSHKAPGPEIWVYDLAQRQRVARFAVPNFTATFLAPMLGFDAQGFLSRGLQQVMPSDGAHSLAVTQDDAPLLFARNAEVGVVAVLDARTGEHLRDLQEAGLAGATLGVD